MLRQETQVVEDKVCLLYDKRGSGGVDGVCEC